MAPVIGTLPWCSTSTAAEAQNPNPSARWEALPALGSVVSVKLRLERGFGPTEAMSIWKDVVRPERCEVGEVGSVVGGGCSTTYQCVWASRHWPADPPTPPPPPLPLTLHPLHARSHGLVEDYNVGKILGKGAFGQVFLAQERATGELCAVKTISKAKLVGKEDVEDVRREVEILSLLSPHRCIAGGAGEVGGSRG